MHFRMVLKSPQHSEAVRQRQRGDIGEEIRVALHPIQERPIVWLIRDQAVAASVGGDDRDAFLQGHPQLVGVTGGLVLSGQDDLIPDVTEEGNLMPGKPSVNGRYRRLAGSNPWVLGRTLTSFAPASTHRSSSSIASRL